MTNTKIRNWLFAGSPESWEFSLSQSPIPWGFVKNYEKFFGMMKNGDITWFYVTKPIMGVIGYGIIRENYRDNLELWPFEKKHHTIKWPLKVRVQVIKSLLPEEWSKRKLVINDLKFMKGAGLQILNPETANIIFKRSMNVFDTVLFENTKIGANVITSKVAEKEKGIIYTEIEKKDLNIHKNTQNIIAEIGSLQNYYSQLEYPINLTNESKNIDVVWKREFSGVPTFAFEVELSGQIEKAIARLKHAYVNWNSRPRIIIPNEMQDRIKNQISIEDKNFKEQIKFYNLEQITILHKSKIALREMEKQMGLY